MQTNNIWHIKLSKTSNGTIFPACLNHQLGLGTSSPIPRNGIPEPGKPSQHC